MITPFWGCSVPQSDFMADPSACGWVLKEGRYDIVWYEGDQLPKDIVANINAIPPEIDTGESKHKFIPKYSYIYNILNKY